MDFYTFLKGAHLQREARLQACWEKSDDALVNVSHSYKNTEYISQVPKK